MKNNTKQLSVTVCIDATEKKIFDVVTNWEEQNKWVFLTNVRGIGNNSHRIGGKIEAFTGVGKIGFVDTMTITAWEDCKLCEVTHTGNVVKGRGLFGVSSVNSVTYFSWTEYVELPYGYIGLIGWVFVKPITKLSLWISLNRLKKYIEQSI